MARFNAQHNIEDLTGRKYRRLEVVKRVKNRRIGKKQKAASYWLCQCDCGSDPKEIKGGSLKQGLTESCGCLHSEKSTIVGKAKLINLKGERFGKLVVSRQAKTRGIKIWWTVQCDCGSDPYEIESYKLRNDRHQCPGCSTAVAAKDLTGEQFGRWTVIERTKNRGNRVFWLAQCSCGSKPRALRSDYFTNKGNATDCGCVYLEGKQKIVGQKFGRFTVKKWLHHTQYLCECSCGSGPKEVDGCVLIDGRTKSCGCLQIETLLQREAGSRGFAGLTGADHPNWTGGSSFFPYPPEFNKLLKKAVRDRDGRSCIVCGYNENGRRHSIHHIDYDKKNNNMRNLVTLCVPCHTKTNSNRAKWQSIFERLMIERDFGLKSESKFEQVISELNKLKELCYYDTDALLDDAAALSGIVTVPPKQFQPSLPM